MKKILPISENVAVLGCGGSGVAAARLVEAQGARSVIFDTGDSPTVRERAAFWGAEALKQAGQDAEKFQLAVLSPGIAPEADLPRAFRDAGVELIGEIEWAWRCREEAVVAITGTNGKTTCTSLTATLLTAAGLPSVPCGNFGRPFSDVVASNEEVAVHTVEVSSFQLETVSSFQPKVAVWLNFAPDHLDRYPGLEEYFEAKRRLFAFQSADDVAVLNALEPVPSGRARQITFSSRPEEKEGDYEYRNGWIHRDGQPFYDYSQGNLRGAHNAENLMAAFAVAREFGADDDAVRVAAKEFRAPRHRCELVAILDGREFLNDSKSTNLHSLASALSSLERRLVLIAGGKDKGLNYEPLTPLIARHVEAVVSIGEIAPRLYDLWKDVADCATAATVPEAVAKALALSKPGQTILFSPGTSSFDMFSGYEERGRVFCDAVLQLFSHHNV